VVERGQTKWEIDVSVWVISWVLWHNKNDLVFNSNIIPNPNALIYNCVSMLQTWAVVVKELDKEGLEKIVTPRVSKPHDYANHMFMRL
jgi:hypothetical protein